MRLFYATQTSVVSLMLLLIPIFLQSSVLWQTMLLLLFVSVAEAYDSPAPTPRSSLLSPLLPLPLILGNSLLNSCVTDGCYFSSISHFAMFTKSISDCTISSLMHYHYSSFQSNTLATGCLYCLNELTAWQICVASECKPSLLILNVSIVS